MMDRRLLHGVPAEGQDMFCCSSARARYALYLVSSRHLAASVSRFYIPRQRCLSMRMFKQFWRVQGLEQRNEWRVVARTTLSSGRTEKLL